MWWLNSNEEGATAVMVTLLLVPIFIAAAFVIDMGLIYWETRQLQNGADAAALAIAQDCADGEPCSSLATTPTAAHYADGNSNDDASDVVVDIPGLDGLNSVTVTTQTRTDSGENVLRHAFLSVTGADPATWERQATAVWGSPGGAATIPLTFSWCEWDQLVDDTSDPLASLPTESKTIEFHVPGGSDCTGPAGHDAPGGWGWLDTTSTEGPCAAQVTEGEVGGHQGGGLPTSWDPDCTADFFESLLGQTHLMPIFERVEGEGEHITYTIAGFAAVEIQAYKLHNGKNQYTSDPAPTCEAKTCIAARFVDYFTYGTDIDLDGGPSFGTVVVGLTK